MSIVLRDTTLESYYLGHGSGVVGWGPIMGSALSKALVQWSKGEYANANNPQDDIAIIAGGANGFGFIADEAGNTRASAAQPGFVDGLNSLSGVISSSSDVDYYHLSITSSKQVIIGALPAEYSPNLDIGMQLEDASGNVLAFANPDLELGASINLSVPPGTYFLMVSGTGRGSTLGDGYSSYGSVGEYRLTVELKPEWLDLSFGSGGKVTTTVGNSYDEGYSVALQNDGKILVAGDTHNGANFDFGLVRYTSGGALDPTFGNGGKVTTPVGSLDDRARSVLLLSDGKIAVAGYYDQGGNNDFVVVRYTAAGALDPSFGSAGKATAGFGNNAIATGAALQSDGKILVAGYVSIDGRNYFTVVRFTSTGALDLNFGAGGLVITAFGSGSAYGMSVAVQADGKILVAGEADNSSNSDFALARYDTNGQLDTTFGSGGKVTTDAGLFAGYANHGRSVAVDDDGKILVAGGSAGGGALAAALMVLVRYTSSGQLDAGFGNGGVVTTHFSDPGTLSFNHGQSVAVQNDGKIVVAGNSDKGHVYQDFALARYTSTGALDTSFGIGGMLTTPIGFDDDIGRSVAVGSDGTIVVAGVSKFANASTFTVVRYSGGPGVNIAPSFAFNTGLLSRGLQTNVTGWGRHVVFPLAGLNATFTNIAAGSSHSLALKSDGTVVAWGKNFYGQAIVPAGLSGVTAIAAGGDHSLALKSDGTVVAWGANF